jgi:hypothetical protein
MILFSPLLVEEQVGSPYDKHSLDAGRRRIRPYYYTAIGIQDFDEPLFYCGRMVKLYFFIRIFDGIAKVVC